MRRPAEEAGGAGRVRQLEVKVRELERLLGRKTTEAEILLEALEEVRLGSNVLYRPAEFLFPTDTP